MITTDRYFRADGSPVLIASGPKDLGSCPDCQGPIIERAFALNSPCTAKCARGHRFSALLVERVDLSKVKPGLREWPREGF